MKTTSELSGKLYGDGVNTVSASLVDGSLNLTTGNGAIKADINVGTKEIKNITFSGSVSLEKDLLISLTKYSTLSYDLDGGHTVLSTTDDTGGKISLRENGITFTSNDGDGSLKVDVTTGEETSTVLYNVKGSITYSPVGDGFMSLGGNTTITASVEGLQSLSITSQSPNTASFAINRDGVKVANTDPEDFKATLSGLYQDAQLEITKLDGLVSCLGDKIIISNGSTLIVTCNNIYTGNSWGTGIVASGDDITISLSNIDKYMTITTAGHFEGDDTSFDHGSVDYDLQKNCHISNGTAFVNRDPSIAIILKEVGSYTVNGTTITNGVAGSTITSDLAGNITYNGTTYAAGTFAIDANGQASGTVINALNSLMSYNDYVAESTLFSVPAINDTTIEDATLTELVSDTKAVNNLTSTLDDATNEFTLKPAQTYLIRYNRSDD